MISSIYNRITKDSVQFALRESNKVTMQTNCPNCGAPIQGPKCEYCGTVFRGQRANIPGIIDDYANIDSTKLGIYLEAGALTPNEVREMMGLKRMEAIKQALKGPYGINW